MDQSNNVTNLIQSAKEQYYNDELKSSEGKNVYSILNRLLNNNVKSLPSCDSMPELSNSFAHFFINKVAKIRQNIATDLGVGKTSVDCIVEASIPPFDTFKPVSAEDIEKVIMSSSLSHACLIHCLCGYVKTMLVL